MSTLPVLPTSSFYSTLTYPFALQPSAIPIVVPASGACAVTTGEPHITTYPSEDDEVEYTYASYGEDISDHTFEFSPNNPNCWTASLAIPTASKITNPVLTSLTYIIKYATMYDGGNSTVQADVVLTTEQCEAGITSKFTDNLGVYRNGPGYGPRIVDNSKAVCLSAAPAIKCNGGNAQWSHYLDHKRFVPNVRVVGPAHLYLNFHVFEYSTLETRRCLAIEVSAVWSDLSENPSDSSDDEKSTAEVEDQFLGADESATLAAAEAEAKKAAAAITAAPPVADKTMQDLIQAKIEELGLEKCSGGFEWEKTATGYICGGKGHSLTFEQLGMKP